MNYFEAVSSSNPTIWWRLHENTGTVNIPNLGSNGLTGTLVGTASHGFVTGAATATNIAWEPRVPFSSSYYSVGPAGFNTRIRSSATSSLFFDNLNAANSPNNAWTVEWMARVTGGVGGHWFWNDDSSPYKGWGIYSFTDSTWPQFTLIARWRSGTSEQNWTQAFTTTGQISDGGWHHYVCIWRGPTVFGVAGGIGTVFLYIDGAPQILGATGGTITINSAARFYASPATDTSASFGVGGNGNANQNTTNALIAEVAVYDRELSHNEILSHYTALYVSTTNSSSLQDLSLVGVRRVSSTFPNTIVTVSGSGSGSGSITYVTDPRITKINPGLN